MGFYDSRCMITGVSLKGAWTSLVLLEPVQGVLQPVSLACTGEYNQLGSMDSIDETESTKVLFDYFAAKLKIGEFVVDEEYLRAEDCYPFRVTWSAIRNACGDARHSTFNRELRSNHLRHAPNQP